MPLTSLTSEKYILWTVLPESPDSFWKALEEGIFLEYFKTPALPKESLN